MKSEIRNIINLEDITKLRSSMSISSNMPSKNSIVKIIPIEFLEKGVKALIDGKLYIAFIEGKILIKEEIISIVQSVNPFTLSLKLNSELSKDNTVLLDQIIKKFELKNSAFNRNLILKVIEEGNILIKSKFLQLTELLRYIKVSGLELSLLINLVWNNNDKNKQFIDELYSDLFNETFKEVSEGLYKAINELLFSNLPQFIIHQISEKLIYNNKDENIKSLVDKSKGLYEIIKLLNDYQNSNISLDNLVISDYIFYSTKYILQKSVLKEYDYYPDFVLVKKDNELEIIHYSVKKLFNTNDNVSYKVIFSSDSLPFELKGIIRNNFFAGEIDVPENLVEKEEIISIEDRLRGNWEINSDVKVNSKVKNIFKASKLNAELNKLIS
jgi:hypothetical protein